MPRKKLDNSPTMSQRVNEWRKKTSVAYTIKLNKETQNDVIEKLAQVDNKTAYIVDLIRKDLGIKKQPLITLADLSKSMAENEKARLEIDGVIWHATKHDIESDTRIVSEWHRNEDNIICAVVKAR